MSTSSQYNEILEWFEQMSTADQLQLLEKLVAIMLRQAGAQPPPAQQRIMKPGGPGKASTRRNM